MTRIESETRRRATLDLAIVVGVFAVGSLSIPLVNPLLRAGHGVSGVFAAAAYQFALEGLAPLTLIIARHESLASFGFARRNLRRSLILAVLLAALYDGGISWSHGALLWIPLRRQPAVRMSLAAPFPFSILGLSTTIFVWGWLEGAFGVYFAKKVSEALGRNGVGWFAPGVIAFALFNGLVHLIVGQGLEGFLTSFASGYAIAVIPAVTRNAWGSTLVQTLTNAVGQP